MQLLLALQNITGNAVDPFMIAMGCPLDQPVGAVLAAKTVHQILQALLLPQFPCRIQIGLMFGRIEKIPDAFPLQLSLRVSENSLPGIIDADKVSVQRINTQEVGTGIKEQALVVKLSDRAGDIRQKDGQLILPDACHINVIPGLALLAVLMEFTRSTLAGHIT